MLSKTSNIICLLLLLALFSKSSLCAQEQYAPEAFNDRRVINSHSVEMIKKGEMDFRVYHRFGDLLGAQGGWATFYGLENATDVGIGFDYGLNDNINIGLTRVKGSGELQQLVSGFFKARLMRQHAKGKGRNPLSITVLGVANVSTMPKSKAVGVLASFPKWSNRMAYHMQIMIARRFGAYFSIQANLNYTYRDIVYTYDQNDLVSIGLSSRLRMSKVTSFIFDATLPILDSNRKTPQAYFPPIGLGLEFETGGGHIFQVNLTNAKGLLETDYIPYSFSDWSKGAFRIGFTISRKFNIL